MMSKQRRNIGADKFVVRIFDLLDSILEKVLDAKIIIVAISAFAAIEVTRIIKMEPADAANYKPFADLGELISQGTWCTIVVVILLGWSLFITVGFFLAMKRVREQGTLLSQAKTEIDRKKSSSRHMARSVEESAKVNAQDKPKKEKPKKPKPKKPKSQRKKSKKPKNQ